MRTEVLKLDYLSGGSLNSKSFYDDEVIQVKVQEKRKMQISKQHDGKPRILYKSYPWREIAILLKPLLSDTIDDIETIQNLEVVVRVYYKYKLEPTEYIGMKILPNIDMNYFSGMRDAENYISLAFIEINRFVSFTFDLMSFGR